MKFVRAPITKSEKQNIPNHKWGSWQRIQCIYAPAFEEYRLCALHWRWHGPYPRYKLSEHLVRNQKICWPQKLRSPPYSKTKKTWLNTHNWHLHFFQTITIRYNPKNGIKRHQRRVREIRWSITARSELFAAVVIICIIMSIALQHLNISLPWSGRIMLMHSAPSLMERNSTNKIHIGDPVGSQGMEREKHQDSLF